MRRKGLLIVLIAVIAAIVAAGCGSDDEASTDESPATGGETTNVATTPAETVPETTARTPAEPTRVRVVLGKPTEFSLVVTPREIPAGPVIFTVVNEGTTEHELVILQSLALAADLNPEDIVHGEEQGRVNEHPEHQEPGTTMVIRATLKAGHFSMICNVPGHYQAGQFADFVVT